MGPSRYPGCKAPAWEIGSKMGRWLHGPAWPERLSPPAAEIQGLTRRRAASHYLNASSSGTTCPGPRPLGLPPSGPP